MLTKLNRQLMDIFHESIAVILLPVMFKMHLFILSNEIIKIIYITGGNFIKKYIALALIVFAFIAYCFFCNLSMPIVNDVSLLDIDCITENLENGEFIDITDEVAIDAIENTITQYSCKLQKSPCSPYLRSSVQYELNGNYNNKPIHILLGEINIVYSNASEGGHKIINHEDLLSEMSAIVNLQK